MLSLNLRDVVAPCVACSLPAAAAERRARWLSWSALAQQAGLAETLPQARPAAGAARALGADTASILAGLGIPC